MRARAKNGGWYRETGATHRRWLSAGSALAFAVLVGACVIVPAGRSDAAQNGAWSVSPTPNPKPRLFLTPRLHAGTTYRDSVTITNMTPERLAFNVYAADALITPSGAFSLARRTDPKRGVAAWTHLPYNTISLAPRTALVVPFTITVPKDAPAGDEPGGIVAELQQGTYTQRGSLGVNVLEAVGARIYARVDGPIRPALTVSDLHIAAARSVAGLAGGPVDATIRYTVRDSGNVFITSETVRATVSGTFGAARRLPPVTLPELLPGSSLQIVQHVHGIEPFGTLHATVDVTSPTATAHAATRTIVIPWLALAALLALIGSAFWWWRRRRTRTGPKPEAPPEPDETPSLATVS